MNCRPGQEFAEVLDSRQSKAWPDGAELDGTLHAVLPWHTPQFGPAGNPKYERPPSFAFSHLFSSRNLTYEWITLIYVTDTYPPIRASSPPSHPP